MTITIVYITFSRACFALEPSWNGLGDAGGRILADFYEVWAHFWDPYFSENNNSFLLQIATNQTSADSKIYSAQAQHSTTSAKRE